jgi:hypothetical protein
MIPQLTKATLTQAYVRWFVWLVSVSAAFWLTFILVGFVAHAPQVALMAPLGFLSNAFWSLLWALMFALVSTYTTIAIRPTQLRTGVLRAVIVGASIGVLSFLGLLAQSARH